MLSTVLMVVALTCTLGAASLHRRVSGWRRVASHAAGPVACALALAFAPGGALIEKMLTRLLYPVGLLWFLGLAVAWGLLVGGRTRPAAAVIAVWLVYSAAGNTWVARASLRWLEADYSPPAETARFDAVIVLGGGTDIAHWDGPQLSASGDRLRVGARLYRRGQAAALVCTGSSIPGLSQHDRRDLTAEAAALWADMGIPDDAIIRIPGPHNTSLEIAALAELAAEREWRRVGLVTSAWHLRRAVGLAERAGLEVTPIPADARGRIPPASIVGLIPSGGDFFALQMAWKEVAAALIGR